MGLNLRGKVQVAGVIDRAEAELLVAAGVDLIGFPLGLRDGREDLDIATAAAIIRALPKQVTPVCITYLDRAADIAGLCHDLGARWVQLHGSVDLEQVQNLRQRHSGLRIVKSLIVCPGAETKLMRAVADFEAHVDAFITDTFDRESGRSGATGKTHDWTVSRRIVMAAKIPVILAGGLTPSNVEEGIAQVGPAAVDAHTGVEGPDGRKHAGLTAAFMRNACSAFAKTS